MRLFVAVDPGSQLRAELATALDGWRSRLRIGWVPPQNWHLTLVFLGEWSPERVPALQKALHGVAAQMAAFDCAPGDLGAFPSLRAPRVLFLHVQSDGALEGLAAAVREAVAPLTPAEQRDRKPFRAHLTLARIKRPLPAAQRQGPAEMRPGPLTAFPVAEFKLIRSELHPDGARYSDLAVFPLQRG